MGCGTHIGADSAGAAGIVGMTDAGNTASAWKSSGDDFNEGIETLALSQKSLQLDLASELR